MHMTDVCLFNEQSINATIFISLYQFSLKSAMKFLCMVRYFNILYLLRYHNVPQWILASDIRFFHVIRFRTWYNQSLASRSTYPSQRFNFSNNIELGHQFLNL